MNDIAGITCIQGKTELTFLQQLAAPQELSFAMFAEAEHVKQWWGPEGWAMPFCSVDFRPGGEWRYCIRNKLGEEHWSQAIYSEIVRPERIVFTDQFITAAGDAVSGTPSKRVTITLAAAGTKTDLKVHIQLKTEAELGQLIKMGFARGFPETLHNLQNHINQVTRSA